MPRLIVVSEYMSENQNSTGYYFSKIVKNVSKSEIEVIAVYPLGRGEVTYFPNHEVKEESFVNGGYDKNKLGSRFMGQLSTTLKLIAKLICAARKRDVVFSGTNPVALLVFIPFLKKIINFKWIVLVYDVYPNNLLPAGLIGKNSLLYKLLLYFFSYVYSSADQIIVIGRDMEDLMKGRVRDVGKIKLLPNWSNLEEILKISKEDAGLLQGKDLEGKVVFQFFGNIGRLQGIENIIDAIKMVKSKNAAFVFIGDGALVGKVKEFIRSNPERSVFYLGSIPLKNKNIGLASCDVALVTLEKGMLGLGVPSKSYFSMAVDKPILAVMEKEAEISRVVEEHKIGWRCDPGSPEELSNLIDKICQEGMEQMTTSPRKVLEKNFSEKVAMGKLLNILRKSFEKE